MNTETLHCSLAVQTQPIIKHVQKHLWNPYDLERLKVSLTMTTVISTRPTTYVTILINIRITNSAKTKDLFGNMGGFGF